MLESVLAATVSATPSASTQSGTPVSGGIEITIFLILGATLLIISGAKLLFQNS